MNDLVLSALQDLAYALVTVGVGFVIAFLKNKIGVTGMQKLAEQSGLIKQVIEAGVKYAEQTFQSGEKLEKAIEWVSTTLNSKGIKISASEIEGLIEATLRDIKDQFGEDWANATKTDPAPTPTTDQTANVNTDPTPAPAVDPTPVVAPATDPVVTPVVAPVEQINDPVVAPISAPISTLTENI